MNIHAAPVTELLHTYTLKELLEISDLEEEDVWPAPGSEDTELGVLMEPEVGHGETEVYAGVQA